MSERELFEQALASLMRIEYSNFKSYFDDVEKRFGVRYDSGSVIERHSKLWQIARASQQGVNNGHAD